MKNIFVTSALLMISVISVAQDAETEIGRLESIEHKAMQEQDTVTLSTLIATDIIVNTPSNKIVSGRTQVFAMKKAGAKFLSFEREVEKVVVKGDVAISMGKETVITSLDSKTQLVSKRRYTNVWLKQNGKWILSARQASEICEPK